MQRITNSHLDAMCRRINQLTGNSLTYWDGSAEKRETAVGHYHISGAYGGVELHQTVNESGGVRDVLHSGYTTKRDLYDRMAAYIYGLEDQANR